MQTSSVCYAGFLDGPPVSGAMAARQRREAGAANAAVGAGAPGAAPGDAARREALERRQAAMNSVKPPPEIGQQRIAGVSVGGGRSVVAGMSREEVAAAQLAGLQVSGQVGKPAANVYLSTNHFHFHRL